jgi:hypothetical protein
MLRRQLLIGSLGSLAIAASRRSALAQAVASGRGVDGAPVVWRRAGEVRGRSEDGVHVFQGIPFAAPPFGPNHLQPPRAPEP